MIIIVSNVYVRVTLSMKSMVQRYHRHILKCLYPTRHGKLRTFHVFQKIYIYQEHIDKRSGTKRDCHLIDNVYYARYAHLTLALTLKRQLW